MATTMAVGTFGIPKIIWNFGMRTENRGGGHRDARSGSAFRGIKSMYIPVMNAVPALWAKPWAKK